MADPLAYEPNTLDLYASVAEPFNQYGDEKELDYWLAVRLHGSREHSDANLVLIVSDYAVVSHLGFMQVLADQLPTVVEKAVASEQHSEGQAASCISMYSVARVICSSIKA